VRGARQRVKGRKCGTAGACISGGGAAPRAAAALAALASSLTASYAGITRSPSASAHARSGTPSKKTCCSGGAAATAGGAGAAAAPRVGRCSSPPTCRLNVCARPLASVAAVECVCWAWPTGLIHTVNLSNTPALSSITV